MSVIIFSALSMGQSGVFAVSSPSLGAAGNYGILASTFTNAATGVSVAGDVGYTTAPAVAAQVNGTIFVNNGTYSQAGTDQGSALSTLNALSCTQSFGSATDLATTNSANQTTIGHYEPGVYCIGGAQSIGTAGITLNGSGTYVFRSTGALNTVANSHIMLVNGANASDIFWTPVVTTLGATSNFTGTVIDPAGITMGTDVTWLGRALAFGNTVTATANDKITVPGFVQQVTLTSIAITTPATKLSYTVGDSLNTAGLVVTGLYSNGTHIIVTPTSVTGFSSVSPVVGQVLTVHVGTVTTTYTINVVAAISNNLGTASTYVILSGSVITNGVPNELVTGNTGHVSTLTAPFAYINGSDHIGALQVGTITSIGTPLGDQHTQLVSIGTWNGTVNTGSTCTFTFANGAINLATDTTHGTIGQYAPGVYCINGAASIGTAGITLNATGTYVFKMNGALTSVSGSTVSLTNGASINNVFWAPVGGASLGANTQFSGTILSGPAAITTGANDIIQGRLISESAVTIGAGANTIGTGTNTFTAPPTGAPLLASTDIGTAKSYIILSGSVITNGVPGQLIGGSTGHVSTLSAPFNYTTGSDHIGALQVGTLTTLGTPLGDQHAVLGNIGTWDGSTNTGLACTFTFANGAINLATDTTHGTIGHYTPGVYCINGAASIGTAGITLDGSGTYVFKMNGALTSALGSTVSLTNGATADNVFWAPVGGASLGANTQFSGTILSGAAAITTGANDIIQGRLISESAVTIGAGANTLGAGASTIITPGGVSLSSIAVTTPATKLSYNVGDSLNTAGLVVTGTLSNGTQIIVIPNIVTGFNSLVPVTGQVLTIYVGTHTTTYTINVVATAPLSTVLGTAGSYVILSGSVITNGVPNQLVTGNTGHVSTLSAPFAYINGSDHVGAGTVGTITTLGTPLGDQHTQLVSIGTWNGATNTGSTCTFTFINGAINLATDTTHGTIGHYTPGVYCINGAASIGTAGITLDGSGTYVFKMNGALTSVSGSTVSLTNGATADNVFWAPVGGASLGANTQFSGIILSGPAAITTGANDIIQGRLISESAVTIGAGANTIGTGTNTFTAPPTGAPILASNNLGTAGSYVILSGSVITNGVPNQLVTGNTGHVSTLSAPFNYTAGSDHIGALQVGTLTTLGTPLGDQHAVLGNIGTWDGSTNTGLACTFTFAPGAINLATDTTHGTIGQYAPGVYCINGAASIGTAGITLNANGTYVFKMNGALTSALGSTVSLTNGASINNVFWAPVGGASLGANTQFSGTILSGAAAITTGANDIIQGRLISESAVTIGAGANTLGAGASTIITPGGVSLSSIAVTTPATKLSYNVGDSLNTAGLVVTGTLSNGTQIIVTPNIVTGFNSASPVTGQVLTIYVGTHTTTYTINVGTVSPVTTALGTAGTYVILSGSVITNGVPNQLVTGNTGHVSTLSAPFNYTTGSDHIGALQVGTLTTLGTPLGDQHAELVSIGTWNGATNTGSTCTFTFAPGAINLATDTTHGTIGQYAPGVYCINGAASIGTAGITLDGSGIYIFKMNGALTSVSGSTVSLANGATLNNVFWAPVGGASLGANTQFSGTILSGPAAITTGANDIIQGRLISESAVTIGAGANTIAADTTAFTAPPSGTPILTSNNLGTAGTYVILSGSVITNGVPNQLVTGNTGHVSTLSAPFNYTAGSDHIGALQVGTLTTLGTPLGDQHAVLGNIGTWNGANNTGRACTFTFANGAINLATDTTHGTIGHYTPGVYCINGAASIGTAGITLDGAGTYVFKMNGALTSVSGSTVSLANGATLNNVFWAPVGGASLGANTQFSGTILSGPAAITTGANDIIQGRLISESAVTIGAGANTFTSPSSTGSSAAIVTLLNIYNSRHDLQVAFPEAAGGNISNLLGWAGTSGISIDSASSALKPYSSFYLVMSVYHNRGDLQAAFPEAANGANISNLLGWAGSSGISIDSASSTLSPYAPTYKLMQVYNVRSDLQGAFPEAANMGNIKNLLTWAGQSGITSDSASSTLSPYAATYKLLQVYNSRSDLQSAFPVAANNGNTASLLCWAKNSGITSDSASSILSAFASFYNSHC